MPYASPRDQQKRNRAYFQARKLKGLCYRCGQQAKVGKTRCFVCLPKESARSIAHQNKLRALGKCIRCQVDSNKSLCLGCRRKTIETTTKRRAQDRIEVREHYGTVCVCCLECEPQFLTIDHIKGNGRKHRSKHKISDIVNWLAVQKRKTGKWPKGFRTLCYNCNAGRWRNGGKCPHERKNSCPQE